MVKLFVFSVWLGNHCAPNIVVYAISALPEVISKPHIIIHELY